MKLYAHREGKHSETIVEGFAKTFQRHRALNLEHWNLLIFTLIGSLLPHKQIENTVHEWVGQSFDIIQVAT